MIAVHDEHGEVRARAMAAVTSSPAPPRGRAAPPARSPCPRRECRGHAADAGTPRGRVAVVARRAPDRDVPALKHGEPGADVAHGDRHVHDAVVHRHVGGAAGNGGRMAASPADLLGRVLRARGDEHGTQSQEQRALGDARGAVRGAHGRVGGEREHQRPAGGGDRGDGGPVGHSTAGLRARARRRLAGLERDRRAPGRRGHEPELHVPLEVLGQLVEVGLVELRREHAA